MQFISRPQWHNSRDGRFRLVSCDCSLATGDPLLRRVLMAVDHASQGEPNRLNSSAFILSPEPTLVARTRFCSAHLHCLNEIVLGTVAD